jgi:antitoxin ParD1/3/4
VSRNISISLGDYFENFVHNKISTGRFKNVSEVVKAGLHLLEEEENKIIALKQAIEDEIESELTRNFDAKKNGE